MTLSEAIRAGAKRHPQCLGRYLEVDYANGGEIVGSCALGAALIAAMEERLGRTIRTAHELRKAIRDAGFFLEGLEEVAMRMFHAPSALIGRVIEWNDYWQYGRQRIADLVASWEPQEKETSHVA